MYMYSYSMYVEYFVGQGLIIGGGWRFLFIFFVVEIFLRYLDIEVEFEGDPTALWDNDLGKAVESCSKFSVSAIALA